ncbi:LytR/AlgR family response regulator transcription factor [Sungkyunkwania multivorans]|uniref:LytR/AlgR family response regulator transcription factor n=1 Tax=Sungkyunkwania multivorans TaxID=1173618 RepID=A0ABW3CZT6_9FLAO
MIGVVIVEDEIGHLQHLTRLLEKYYPEMTILGNADNVQGAIKLIEDTDPELVFLDIQLRVGNGFDVLDHFGSTIKFETVFTTSFLDYKEKAMDYFAFYYLNKPLVEEELKKVLDRYISKKTNFDLEKYLAFKKQLENKDDYLTLSTSSGYEVLDVRNIIFCEANGSYCAFHTTDNKQFVSSNNLKKVESLLQEANFCRIHRSILINLKHVKGFNKDGVINLTNGHNVTIASRNRKNILNMLKIMYGIL